MAASLDESKAVTPFMPTLLHCSLVKIAVRMFEEFGVDILEEAFTEIQLGNLTASEGNSTKIGRAKARLLHIPAHLRQGVMAAVHGSHHAVSEWTWHHSKFKEEKSNLHWMSDGSIDAVKTARNLVQNAKLDDKDRFELACVYCLEDSVKALWAKMETSGEIESFSMRHEDIVSFWVGWLRNQPAVSWTQSLGTWLPQRHSRIMDNLSALVPRCSACFPQLRPEERGACFELFDYVSLDDLRFCLYTFTKDEEEQTLSTVGPFGFLRLHLMWPLQTLFLDTVERLWGHMDKYCFQFLLCDIFKFNDEWKDFNYMELFERFWEKSPPHLKESVKERPELRKRINSYFDDVSRKRKSVHKKQRQKLSKKEPMQRTCESLNNRIF